MDLVLFCAVNFSEALEILLKLNAFPNAKVEIQLGAPVVVFQIHGEGHWRNAW